MSVFLRRFLNNRKYILLAMVTVFISGCLFGFYQYHFSSQPIKDFFEKLFYLNIEGYENNYQLFVIQNGAYLLISTYLSSSYLGHAGILYLLFLKGIQIAFSCLCVFTTVPFSFLVLLLIIFEIILEILLCFITGYMYIYISVYVTMVTFCVEQNFNIKSMMNYKLNCLICGLIIFSLALVFRVYIIPMF